MTVKKLQLYTIAKRKNHYICMYWCWYQQDNERELLYQLNKILEEDDERIENGERSYTDD